MAGGSPNGRAGGEGRGVGRADVAAVVSRARGRRAGSGAAAGAVAGRARGAARRAGVGGCGASGSSWRWCSRSPRFSALVGGARAAGVAVVAGRRVGAGGPAVLGGSCCGCCTRCVSGGRGRGRRSTRASRLVRSGARACGRSRACPRVTCSTCACAAGSRSRDLDARREHLAACLRAREVRVVRIRRDAARASVLVVRRDPFEDAASDAVAGCRRGRAVAVGADPGRRRRAGRARWRSSWSSATC